jgi:hypothetical protein
VTCDTATETSQLSLDETGDRLGAASRVENTEVQVPPVDAKIVASNGPTSRMTVLTVGRRKPLAPRFDRTPPNEDC